jgi:hypothetical protein
MASRVVQPAGLVPYFLPRLLIIHLQFLLSAFSIPSLDCKDISEVQEITQGRKLEVEDVFKKMMESTGTKDGHVVASSLA